MKYLKTDNKQQSKTKTFCLITMTIDATFTFTRRRKKINNLKKKLPLLVVFFFN